MIKTDRLVIRPLKLSDSSDMYEYLSDPEVMHFIPEGVHNHKQVEDLIKANLTPTKFYAVELAETLKVIGHISFEQYFGDHTYEIGWVFSKKHQGSGYCTETARAMLDYNFSTNPKLHRVIATCQPENPASYKVMEHISMRKEGFFKQCIPAKNGWWDEYFYAILRSEWLAHQDPIL